METNNFLFWVDSGGKETTSYAGIVPHVCNAVPHRVHELLYIHIALTPIEEHCVVCYS